jgi:S1-C subfamily serine protease
VAVIKIDFPAGGEGVPTLPLGDSDEIGVGDWAIAVGNPMGELEGTVTVGVVSAKGRRDLQIAGGGPTYQDFIQTDASINFGNSGGPLVNSRGEVVGINSAINPASQGIGFAIPMNMARKVGAELIRSGTVRRGYLGIIPQEVTREVREVWGLSEVEGILVGNVEPETPAAEAGLEVGDIILDFANRSTSDVPSFRAFVAEAGVGIEVPVTVLRDGKRKSLEVTLAERPDTQEPPVPHEAPVEPGEDWLGAEVESISPELAEEYELDRRDGVVVTRVSLGGAAARGGLREGDVVLEVNRQRVRDENQLRRELSDAHRARKPAVLLVERGGITTFVSVRPLG